MKPRNKIQPLPFVLPALFVYILTVIIPILWSMGYSLFSWNGIGDMKFIGLENYVRMFQDETFREAVVNNLKFVVLGSLFQLCAGLILATYFQRWKYSAGYLFYSMYHFIYGDLPDFFQNAFCPAPGPGLLCDGKTGNGTYRFAGKFPYSADYHNPDRWI
jgi:raffinose/stachyose/melibiose transport system permease protein